MSNTQQYAVRHNDQNGPVERWFTTRDLRTAYLMSIGCPPLLSWEDPEHDVNMTNPYAAGRPL